MALVESEKTAIICSELMPRHAETPICWMALGGLGQLRLDMLLPLRGYQIVAYPDTDPEGEAYRKWRDLCHEFAAKLGHPVYVSNVLEQFATAEQKQRKIDIADLIHEQ